MMPVNGQQWSAMLMQMQMQQLQQMQMQRINQIQFQQQMPQYQQQNDEEHEKIPEEERTLFCANIDEKRVDEEMLFELFLQAGPIEKIHFPKQKTFCFITYVHSCSPAYAMHLFQNVKLFGQNLVIKFNGTTNPPPLTRRLLPPDWGVSDFTMPDIVPNPFRRSFDNAALRSSRLAAFMDDSRDSRDRDDDRNHRRNRSPPKHSRDRSGSDNNRRHERNHNDSDRNWVNGPDRRSRSHHSSGPYDRRRF